MIMVLQVIMTLVSLVQIMVASTYIMTYFGVSVIVAVELSAAVAFMVLVKFKIKVTKRGL